MMSNLLPCPFCGNSHEPKIVSSYDMDTEDLGNDEYFAVFCDAEAGWREVHKGCGSSSGYAKTKELAVTKWNNRQQLTKPADDTISVSKGEWEAVSKDAERYRIHRDLWAKDLNKVTKVLYRKLSTEETNEAAVDALTDEAIQGASNG